MKKKIIYLVVFLFFNILYSQNFTERNKIISLYNKGKIEELTNSLKKSEQIQEELIQEFVKRNPYAYRPQKIINNIPIYYTANNTGSSLTIRTDALYPNAGNNYSLTGLGMTAGVWDGGKIRETHQELLNKITFGDNASTLNTHSTHVAGTIIASGISTSRKGIAYQGSVIGYDWNSDTSEMLSFASQGYLVSNHSYGTSAGSLPTYYFGQYNSQSAEIDDLAFTFPNYLIVKAAGNDRNDLTINQVVNKGGYDLLTGYATAKNALTVGAVNQVNNYIDENSVIMSDFSNWGPTDDGRIKPDICAKGVNVNSCISTSDVAYAIYQGTSMATPAITGMVLLLQQCNNTLYSSYLRAASIKGLITHSARECGVSLGPDYQYGWGLADALTAANIIRDKTNSSVLEEKTLQQSEIYTKNINVSSLQNLRFSISWTDPAGNANSATSEDSRSPRLKNNLDIKVLKDGITYYPWKLDADVPWNDATNNSDNDVDNFERIDILNAQPGVYTIQVSHKGILLNGAQDYTLIASGTIGISLNTKNYEFDKSIFVYPNPTSSILNFNITENIELLSISISDISGKNVMQIPYSDSIQNKINLENLQSGVYFVKFTTKDNVSVVKKIVKE